MLNVHRLANFLSTPPLLEKSHVLILGSDLENLQKTLRTLNIKNRVLCYPEASEPYEASPSGVQTACQRLQTLAHLKTNDPFTLLMSPLAWLEKRPVINPIRLQPLMLCPNQHWSHSDLIGILHEFSYVRSDLVQAKGTYAVRGDRIDIFSPQCAYPVRVDFFGDTVEVIKYFNILTQKTVKAVDKIEIWAVSETGQEGPYHHWPLHSHLSCRIEDFFQTQPVVFIEPTIDLQKIWSTIVRSYQRNRECGRQICEVERLFTMPA